MRTEVRTSKNVSETHSNGRVVGRGLSTYTKSPVSPDTMFS